MGIQAASKAQERRKKLEYTPAFSPIEDSKRCFIPELQIFRGPGCLLVFAVHCTVVLFPFLMPAPADRSRADYLPHAVIGFFILSGLVLTLPFVGDNARKFSTKTYYFQRFLRLYPVYWLSLLSALALRFAVTHWATLPATTPWPVRLWSVTLTPKILVTQFAGVFDTARTINPAYWTLNNEIQACLFFPLVIVLVRRTRHWIFSLLAIAGMIVATHYLDFFPVVRTLSYFVMGAYVAKYNRELKGWLQRMPRALLWTGLVLLAGFMWVAPSSGLLFRIAFPLLNMFLALSAVMVQAFQPLAWLARLRPVQRMADLSYCFYVTHLPILASCAVWLGPRLHSPILTALVALSLSIFVAWILWSLVEMPIRRWAKGSTTESAARGAHGLIARETAAS